MKRVLIVVVLIVAAAMLGLWRSHGGVRAGLNRVMNSSGDGSPGVTGDETRKTLDLKAGTTIRVEGINGHVDIQTAADGKTTEAVGKRPANNPRSLRRREESSGQTGDGLLVPSNHNTTALWDDV